MELMDVKFIRLLHTQKAMHIGGALFHCKALLVGFLCGAGVTYILLLAVGMSFKATPTLSTFDVVSMHIFRHPISVGHFKDRIGKNQTWKPFKKNDPPSFDGGGEDVNALILVFFCDICFYIFVMYFIYFYNCVKISVFGL